jgi:hypothetical protein
VCQTASPGGFAITARAGGEGWRDMIEVGNGGDDGLEGDKCNSSFQARLATTSEKSRRPNLVEALREVCGAGVGELEAAGRNLGGGADGGPVLEVGGSEDGLDVTTGAGEIEKHAAVWLERDGSDVSRFGGDYGELDRNRDGGVVGAGNDFEGGLVNGRSKVGGIDKEVHVCSSARGESEGRIHDCSVGGRWRDETVRDIYRGGDVIAECDGDIGSGTRRKRNGYGLGLNAEKGRAK